MMHSEYQNAAMRTMPSLSPEQLPNWALGLCGEVGELAQDFQYCRPMQIEIGDVLWYCHALLTCLRLDADAVLADLPVVTEFDWFAASRVAEQVKKHVYHFKPLNKQALIQDIRTLVAGCVFLLRGETLEECYRQNVEKLLARYPNGFE
jgi:hypothetical protein